MFEYIVLRRGEDGRNLSAGKLAEAMLFYQRVHLVIDRGTLHDLIKQIGLEQVLELTRRPGITAVYTEEFLGTHSTKMGPLEVHDFGAMTFAGAEGARTLKTTEDRIEFDLERNLDVPRARAKRFSQAFLKKVPVRRLSGDHFIKGGVPDAARADLRDSAFVRAAVRRLLALTPEGYDPGAGLKFDVLGSDLGHYVFHNVDLDAINRRRVANGIAEALTIGHLLTQILEARGDLAIGASYGGDFVTSEACSSVVRLRHELLFQSTDANVEHRRNFAEIVLPDVPTVRESVDSGERDFGAFLRLLDKAERFREWLRDANPDEGLAREYLRAVTSQDWIQTTKGKSLRYFLTLLIEGLSPTGGSVAGFADNFLIEKLLGGWRPNHFVENRLQPFLLQR